MGGCTVWRRCPGGSPARRACGSRHLHVEARRRPAAHHADARPAAAAAPSCLLQTVVVDCRGHMLGRLASVIAKQILSGQHVVSACAMRNWRASRDGLLCSAAARQQDPALTVLSLLSLAFSLATQVCVRTEEINISGGMVRQKAKYERFLRKRSVTNPRRGAVKFRCALLAVSCCGG